MTRIVLVHQKRLVVVSCASSSRDNLSYLGQWSTLVVKNVRVTSRILSNFPARGYIYDMSNIAIW